MISALVTGTVLALVAMGIVLSPLFFPAEDEAAPAGAGTCRGCGERLLSGARFCSSCGAPTGAGRGPGA